MPENFMKEVPDRAKSSSKRSSTVLSFNTSRIWNSSFTKMSSKSPDLSLIKRSSSFSLLLSISSTSILSSTSFSSASSSSLSLSSSSSFSESGKSLRALPRCGQMLSKYSFAPTILSPHQSDVFFENKSSTTIFVYSLDLYVGSNSLHVSFSRSEF